jgi:hypothetical protein
MDIYKHVESYIIFLFSNMFRSLLWPSSGWPTTMHNYLYIDYMLVVGHPYDGHRGDRNLLENNNNNMWLNIFTNMHLLYIT